MKRPSPKHPDPVIQELIYIRRTKGLSQREVARRAGTSPPSISAAEAGKRSPSLATLRGWLKALDADLTVVRPRCPSKIAHESGVVLQCMDAVGHARKHLTAHESWSDDDDRATDA